MSNMFSGLEDLGSHPVVWLFRLGFLILASFLGWCLWEAIFYGLSFVTVTIG